MIEDLWGNNKISKRFRMYFVQMLQLLYFYLRTIIYKYDGHSVQSKSQIKPSICKAAKILKDKLYFCVINI